MKFKPTPPREDIYRFQKYFRVFISFLLLLLAMWHFYSGSHLLLTDRKHHLGDGLFSLGLSVIVFGLSLFLFRNRSNNTPRYEGMEP